MTSRALVLARGVGRRMQAADDAAQLSDEQRRAADAGQKPLLPIGGRPFLDYVLSSLADAGISHVGLIVPPDHERLRRHYQSEHPPERLRVEFIVQESPEGTADALLAAQPWTAGEPFLVMNADNLYPAAPLRRLAAIETPGLLLFTRSNLVRTSNIPPERVRAFALLSLGPGGYLTDIVEKPPADVFAAAGEAAPVSMNCWRFDARIFRFCREVARSERGEVELPQAVRDAVRSGMKFQTVAARGPVLDLSTRADAAEVESRLAGVTPRP
jgi:dTDP-glucose pyrophosphorylase